MSETWIPISGYDNSYTDYEDGDKGVTIINKSISSVYGTIYSGEKNSQYISFFMDRYSDGIDLSEKLINVCYTISNGGGADRPVNVYKNDYQIKFGWVVPSACTAVDGTITIGIMAVGTQYEKDYVFKTNTASFKVNVGFEGGGGIVEPDDNWFEQFLIENNNIVTNGKSEINQIAQTAISNIDSKVNSANTTIDNKVTTSIQTIENTVEEGVEHIDEKIGDFDTLNARLDNIARLPQGSTTADAELIDIRVKADGTISTSAGSAVREQVSQLNSDLDGLRDSDKCTIQWYRGGYVTSTGKWSGNSLYSGDSDSTMMHPAPMQMLEGDVIPCPNGYTVGIAVYKTWHNADDFEYDSFVARRSTNYTIPSGKSGYWFMPTYKTSNGDILCDKNYSFKVAAFELMRTITPMLCKASSYYSMTKRINALENQMESMTILIQSLTGGVTEKLDQFSTVQYKKKNIDPNNADGFGIWLIRNTNLDDMNGIPDVSGHAMLINITQKSFYSTVQFYIMSSGEHSGMIYMRTKNKKSWSGVEWSIIGGVTNE